MNCLPDGGAYVLRPPVRMMNQYIRALGLSLVQGLLQRIKHEIRSHRTAHTTTHDTTSKHINHEHHVQPALPSTDIGDVRHPQLVGAIGLELSVDPVQRADDRLDWDGGAYNLASPSALQPQLFHQPLDRAASHGQVFSVHLVPDFGTISSRHIEWLLRVFCD